MRGSGQGTGGYTIQFRLEIKNIKIATDFVEKQLKLLDNKVQILTIFEDKKTISRACSVQP